MRALIGLLGNLLLLASLAGLAFILVGPPETKLRATEWLAARSGLHAVAVEPVLSERRLGPAAATGDDTTAIPTSAAGMSLSTQTQPLPTATPAPRLPITRLAIPRVNIQAEVVQAHLVKQGEAVTWEVPAWKAGHAEYTAGAGEQGNAVLLGHVNSRNSGNVFEDLEDVREGDRVEVASGSARFTYRVVHVQSVPRSDVSVVEPTDRPSLTLITCTGAWLPAERDISERLIVRAELMH